MSCGPTGIQIDRFPAKKQKILRNTTFLLESVQFLRFLKRISNRKENTNYSKHNSEAPGAINADAVSLTEAQRGLG